MVVFDLPEQLRTLAAVLEATHFEFFSRLLERLKRTVP